MKSKRCASCWKDKDIDDFRSKNFPSRFNKTCKDCMEKIVNRAKGRKDRSTNFNDLDEDLTWMGTDTTYF